MLPNTWSYDPILAYRHPSDQTVQTGPFGAQLHSDDYVEEGVPFILIRNMVRGGVDKSDMPRITPKDAERLSNYRLKLNDIVFSRVGRVGSCFLTGMEQVGWVISGQLLRLRLDLTALDPRFLVHWIRSPYVERHIGNESVGSTRQSINSTILGNMPVPAIPLLEQTRIAQILDTLDTAIQETEVIIAKLKAVKQGLLHDLLTRGIDANGELRPPQAEAPHLYKPSPLGWIPKVWDCVRLVEKLGVFGGKRLPAGHFYADHPTPFKYLRVTDFFDREYSLNDLENLPERTFKTLERYEIRPGQLYISIAGSLGYVGVHHANGDESVRTILTENAARLAPLCALVPDFVAAYMNSNMVQRQVTSEKGTGGGVPKLALFRIEQFRLAWPDEDEQELIAERLRKVNERIRDETLLFWKLTLQKFGLMGDLLTGRVRVTPLLAEAEYRERRA